jgi:MFS family permease
MCFLGTIGDRIGRKRGSITTASIMLLGAIMLTVMNGATPKGFSSANVDAMGKTD